MITKGCAHQSPSCESCKRRKVYIVTDQESPCGERKMVFSDELQALRFVNDILNRHSYINAKIETYEVIE